MACSLWLNYKWKQYLIQNNQALIKRVWPPKIHGEKKCEIQVGGQEMAVMVGK